MSFLFASASRMIFSPHECTVEDLVNVTVNAQIFVEQRASEDRAVFLPRCMECSRGIAMGILSVRLSVKRVHCDKRKKAMFRFLYHVKEHLS